MGIFGIGTLIDFIEIISENFKDASGKRIINRKEQNISINSISQADELKKYKELLDNNVITQEEFDKKKKQILNL